MCLSTVDRLAGPNTNLECGRGGGTEPPGSGRPTASSPLCLFLPKSDPRTLVCLKLWKHEGTPYSLKRLVFSFKSVKECGVLILIGNVDVLV